MSTTATRTRPRLPWHRLPWRRLPWRRLGLRNRRGIAALEFAFAMPVMLALFGAAVDFGRAVNDHLFLTNAVRAASQYATLFPENEQQIRAALITALGPWGTTAETSGSPPRTVITIECRCNDAPASFSDLCPDTSARLIRLSAQRKFEPFVLTKLLQIPNLLTQVSSNATVRTQ